MGLVAETRAVRPNLYGMSRDELSGVLADYGAPAFHARQVYRWLYARQRWAPREWTDLSNSLRERLAGEVDVEPGRLGDRVEAADGTVKYRVHLPNGGQAESVYMIQGSRSTLCVSSQVGCALDCDFCLTGKMGWKRHLGAGEIAGQVALVRRDRGLEGQPLNVVFMGMGEPLHNYDAVMAAVRLLADEEGFGLSRRRITVSTVGLAKGIERLAREPLRPRLAVSLNATTDAVRDRLMPVNRKYPIARLMQALERFARATGEGFTFEYVLLRGVNDSDDDMSRLAELARGLPVKINLIPFNAVPGYLDYAAPHRQRVLALRDQLLARRVRASIRWSRGRDARAACGQLALLPDAPAGAAEPPPARRTR